MPIEDLPLFTVGISAGKAYELLLNARTEHQWADTSSVRVRRTGGKHWAQCLCGDWVAFTGRALAQHQDRKGCEAIARYTVGDQH